MVKGGKIQEYEITYPSLMPAGDNPRPEGSLETSSQKICNYSSLSFSQ